MSDDLSDISAMSFEEAMKALEQIVSKLEHADVPLDQSIKLYEDGAKLKAHCAAQLAKAQERVEKITLAADGTPQGTTPTEGL